MQGARRSAEGMRRLAAALSVAALAGVATAAAGVPVPGPVVAGFATPSRNIACNAGPNDGRPVLACTVFSAESPTRGQKVWALRPTGAVSVGYVIGNAATDIPTLAYGRSWTWRSIRCVSRSRGLTCRNPSGRGFFLSRAAQRVF